MSEPEYPCQLPPQGSPPETWICYTEKCDTLQSDLAVCDGISDPELRLKCKQRFHAYYLSSLGECHPV